MDYQSAALYMPQECVAKSHALAGALDKSGDIRHDEGLLAALHNSENRGQRCEVVVRDLRLGGADYAYQRGFTDIRESHQTNVSQQLQLQDHVERLAGESRLGKTGDLARRSREVCVALTAAAAPGYYDRLIVRDIRHDSAGVGVLDYGPPGHADYRRLHGLSGAALGAAVLAVRGDVLLLIAEVDQRGKIIVSDKHDVASLTSIAAVRSACIHIFLAVEAYCPVTAVSCLDRYFDLINKHSLPPRFPYCLLFHDFQLLFHAKSRKT